MELSSEAAQRESRLLTAFLATRERIKPKLQNPRKKEKQPLRKSRRNKGSPEGFVSENNCVGKIDPITKDKIQAGIKLECDKKCYDIKNVARFATRKSPFTRAEFTTADNAKVDAYIRGKKGGRSESKRRRIRR